MSTSKDRVLTVSGKRDETEQAGRPICTRASPAAPSSARFQLAEHVEVKAAKLENGLLHVDLERIVPKKRSPAASRSMRRSSGPSKAASRQPNVGPICILRQFLPMRGRSQ